jgi:hypothetical protein
MLQDGEGVEGPGGEDATPRHHGVATDLQHGQVTAPTSRCRLPVRRRPAFLLAWGRLMRHGSGGSVPSVRWRPAPALLHDASPFYSCLLFSLTRGSRGLGFLPWAVAVTWRRGRAGFRQRWLGLGESGRWRCNVGV